ncbi:MAG: hypothetical protein E6I75_28850 [Chloroflexi bacterium]|nr:MAG: hypothetical protein E6I75_28850 [Chloroflexota bacterium]
MNATNRCDHGHAALDEIGCETWQSIVMKICPAELDRHVLAFGIAGLFQTLAEGRGDIVSLLS